MDTTGLTDSEFIRHLEAGGFALRESGGRLRCVVPGGEGLDEATRSEIARRRDGLLAIVRTRRIPLSHEQERLWFLDEYGGPSASAYHMPAAFRIRGPLDVGALERALGILVDRHESLRTVFSSEHGEPYQVIRAEHPVRLDIEPADEGTLANVLADEALRPFDLAKGPLTRFRVFRLGPEDHVFMVCQHHIVGDGWSTGILLDELGRFYSELAAGGEPGVRPPALQYADYSLWQRSPIWEDRTRPGEEYWRGKLQGLEEAELPPDSARPPVMTTSGARVAFEIEPQTARNVRTVADTQGCTPFMVLLAAFKGLLGRLCGQDDVAVGTPVANRGSPDLEETVGFFVNTLVMRTDLEGDPTFTEALQRVKRTCLEAYRHQEVPFGRLVDMLGVARDPSRSPLFDIMFVLRHAEGDGALELPGCTSEVVPVSYPTAKFDLAFELVESPGTLAGEIEYNTDLYTEETARRIARLFERMLDACCADPGVNPRDVELMDDVERERILIGFNDTGAPFPASTVQALFREQAARTPGNTALAASGERMTYQELDEASDAVAAGLRKALGGVVASGDTVIGLPGVPEPGTIVSMLGILKAGCAYLPLDPEHPAERLAFMLEDSGGGAVLGSGDRVPGRIRSARALLEARGRDVPLVEAGGTPGVRPADESGPHSLAYVIYTSGSTGEPKGVMVEQRGVSNLVTAQREFFNIEDKSRVLQFAPLGFDASVSEIFTALLTGASLHIAAPDVRKDADRLVDLLEKDAITTATIPPALLAVLPHRNLPALETLVVAGERCDAETMKRWSVGRRLINAYGPTEATVCASMHVWQEGDPPANIGRPTKNVSMFVLDERMRPCPVGVPGSLFIGGAGLARGYLNRPGLEGEAFIANPFPGKGGARLYRTGDRARWFGTGELEFLGRDDDQVKIRGIRVEPGEIESVLRRHPGVSGCAVVPVRSAGTTRLVAYWVPAPGADVESTTLKDFLASRLPAFMVPSWFVSLDHLPLTSSGKVDRKALPAFDPAELAGSGEGAAPRTPTEKKLAAIWGQVLHLERVAVDDDFFSLGGDSIMSIQVVSRAREAGLRIEPKDLFASPTISALAARADRAGARRRKARRAKGGAVLTPIQSWFFSLDLPDMNHFNQSVMLSLDEPLIAGTLREAVRRLAARHDSLRLRFTRDEDGRWSQAYSDDAGIPVVEIDLSGRPGDLERECRMVHSSMDITAGPVAAAALIDGMPDSRQRLLFAVHHLFVDAVSWQPLLEDLASAYVALSQGKPVRFTSRRSSTYQEWGEALGRYREKAEAQAGYWRDVIDSAHEAPWATDAASSSAGSKLRVTLDAEHTSGLITKAPAAWHAAARDLLVSALLLAWHQTCGARDLLLDLEGHGREAIDDEVEVTRTVGWFTSLYPVLLTLPAPQTAKGEKAFNDDLLRSVKETLRAVPDGGLGYGVLTYMSGGPATESLRAAPAPGVAFNYLGRMDTAIPGKLSGLIDRDTDTGQISASNPPVHPLEINAWVADGRLTAEFAASPAQVPPGTAARFADAFIASLARLVDHCLEPGVGGYTPSDFPLVSLTAGQLDTITRAEPLEVEDVYPLSPMQEGMLFHALYAPASDQYMEQLCWRYTGHLDGAALRNAWTRVVARHAVFRTAFLHEGLEHPVQVVRKKTPIDWRESDWRDVPREALAPRLDDYIRDDRAEGFDLAKAGLVRFHLIRTAPDEHEFIWCFHHILIDGWCSSVLLDELRLRYEALTGGAPFRLPAPPPYRDFISWLTARDADDDAFWAERLAGVTGPTALAINRRPLEIHRPIEEADERTLRMPEALSAKVMSFVREHRVTVNSVLQTAWAMVLNLYSGSDEVVLGVNVSGRPGEMPRVENMVGLFVNAVPVRFQLDRQATALGAVLSMHSEMQAVNEHCYGSLADIQRFTDVPAGTPLFLSEYVFENYPLDETILEGMAGTRISHFRAVEKTNYPLGVIGAPGSSLSVRALYDRGSFTPGSISRMLDHIGTAVEWLVENPSSPLAEAALLPPGEMETVTRVWSGARVPLPDGWKPVGERFADMAASTPDRAAIACEGEVLSYGELLEMSDRIASGIVAARREGVKPRILHRRNPAVGLFATRKPGTVAVILGLNRAGAACVPLDPEYPDGRLRFMAEDARLDAVIASDKHFSRLRDLLPQDSPTALMSLESLLETTGHENLEPPHPEDTAFVIYTSGTTGVPKGVAITARNLADHLSAVIERLGVSDRDVVMQFSTLAFDASLEQLFTALLTGARLAMRGDLLWTPDELKRVVLREGVTVMNLPTGYWRECALAWSADPSALADSKLRLVLPGGDAMDAETVQTWKAIPLPPHRLLNMYGPTETTITATAYEVPDRAEDTVPIGTPIGARRVYVLGADLRQVPPGVPGELYIGGIGVSPGYLDRPAENAARFVDDPFVPAAEKKPGYGRMYKTGDLVRWREDGVLEFVGRVDLQTKLRGFRVEPQEIEAVLGSYPGVAECAVVVRCDGGDRQLVACYVPGTDPTQVPTAAGKAITEWESLYEDLFGREPAGDFDTTGWDSSYDGRPIPEEQMREWVDRTVARVLGLAPGSVLEIGCGTGLILTRVAPHCGSYLGVDFSRQAVERLARLMAGTPIEGVDVMQGRADETLSLVTGAGFHPDTVVINSVVQYFPGIEYLDDVLDQALGAVDDSGRIFIGDVRDLRLQDAFNLSVEIAKAGGMPEGDARSLLARDALDENELLVSPWYFMRFAAEHPRVTGVRLMAKQGRFPNEMNDYRYDVVLETGTPAQPISATEHTWEPGLDLDALLTDTEGPLIVRGYPNTRTWASYNLALRAEAGVNLEDHVRALNDEALGLLPVERLEELAASHGLTLHLLLSLEGDRAPAACDLFFTAEGPPPGTLLKPAPGRRGYTNQPLARETRVSIDPGLLRDFLASRLPEYMVPSHFIELDSIPGTTSGKPDRRALETMQPGPVVTRAFSEPRDEYETLLADVFADVLRLERVGVDDDFFRLGGHSLSATRAASRINRVFGMQLPVKSIFDHPTVASLATLIRGGLSPGRQAPPPLEHTERMGRLPLSFAQERLWFLDRFESVSDTSYNMPAAFRITGPLDARALDGALRMLSRRHESLRTVFSDEEGEPFQVVTARELALEREMIAPDRMQARLDELARRPFDLESGPLARAHLLTVSDREHYLLLNQHHIVSDAWSVGVLMRELSACYDAYAGGREPGLESLPVSYSDYAAWQKRWLSGDVMLDELAYWRSRLEGARRLDIPTDRPRAERAVRRGKQLSFRLDEGVTDRLKSASRQAGASLYMMLLGLFALLLGRTCGEDDVLLGTVTAGRTEEALEEVLGFFVNTVLLRIDLAGDPSFAEVLQRVRETALDAFAHQDLPFERLVAELRPERERGRDALLSALLVFQNVPEAALELAGLRVGPVGLELGAVRSDLDLYAWEEAGALLLCFVYDADLFEPATIETMAGRLQRMAALVARDASSPISVVSSLDPGGIGAPAVPSPAPAGATPLSPHQERLWFIDRFEEGTVYDTKPAYHSMPLVIGFEGPVEEGRLRESLTAVVSRHSALRTRIETRGDAAEQVIEPSFVPELMRIDAGSAGPSRLDAMALEFAGRPFADDEEPRLRAALIVGGKRSLLVLAVHHALADPRSLGIIARDLADAYNDSSLTPEVLPYAAFSEWRRSLSDDSWEPLLYYWRWRMRGELPVLALPEDRPRPAIHTYTAARFSGRVSPLSHIDLESFLLSGLILTLLCFSGQDELVVGIFGDGRPDGAENVVGPFDDLLPVRCRPDPDLTCREFVRSVAAILAEARANGALPFDTLVDRLNPPMDMSRTALFDVLFGLADRAEAVSFGEAKARMQETNLGLGKYDLNLLLIAGPDDGAPIDSIATFNADIYEESTVAAMMKRFDTVLQNLAGSPGTPLRDLSLLSADEQQDLERWNRTTVTSPGGETLDSLLAKRVRETPDATAVTFRDTSVTYGELDASANRLAHRLTELGVGSDRLVALLLDRSIEQVTSMLAVLKAGGAYLPVETSFPADRVAFILEDSQAEVLVTTSDLLDRLESRPPNVVLLDSDARLLETMPFEAPSSTTAPGNLAYCIYTSGSTGRPKGVLVEHGNVVDHLFNDDMPFELASSDVWTMFHSYAFDFSVWEMYGALLTGGRLVIVPAETTRDASLLLDLINNEGVTILNQVPSSFYGLMREALERGTPDTPLRYVVFGGEALDFPALADWHRAFPSVRLINMYGITETCVHVTFKEVRDDDIDAGIGNIGRPLPDTTLTVTDPLMRRLPPGITGEICVGGGGVARGYLNRDDLTATRFVPNPRRPSERLYRSGDLGRFLPDGEIEYLGRIDDQVQVRGFRVEPGEVESVLASHPVVERAAVRVWERTAAGSGPGDLFLSAYYRPSHQAGPATQPEPDELKSYMAGLLPSYMVPSYVVRMDDMPLTPGGKVDRRALPDPRTAPHAGPGTPGPRDPVELVLKGIWEEVTGAGTVSIRDDFFLSGGHSLLAVRLVSRVNASFGTAKAVSWAFINRTVEEQARALREEGASPGFRPVVTFNAGRYDTPVIFVHPGQAGAEAYSGLVSLIGDQIPFHAIESRNLFDTSRPMLTTVEELAAAYLADVLPLIGDSPVILGGWSFGGTVAFELASRLAARGVTVRSLLLIDAILYDEGEQALLRELANSAEADGLLEKTALYPVLPEEYRARLRELMKVEFEALACYTGTTTPYPGFTVLLKPTEARPPDPVGPAAARIIAELSANLEPKDDNGWSALASDLEVRRVPGDHVTMMQGRGLKEVARVLSAIVTEGARANGTDATPPPTKITRKN